MSPLRNKPLNVGDKLRRYEKIDVALQLVCNVTLDTTKFYIKLQHEDQLRLDLWLLLSNAPQLAAGFFTQCPALPITQSFNRFPLFLQLIKRIARDRLADLLHQTDEEA